MRASMAVPATAVEMIITCILLNSWLFYVRLSQPIVNTDVIQLNI